MTDQPQALSNVAEIDSAIIDTFKEAFNLDKDIAATREKHMAPLTKAKTKLWRKLKAKANVTDKVLKAFYELHALEWAAQDFDDEAERVRAADEMRLVFDGLVKNQTLNFFDVMEGDFKPKFVQETEDAQAEEEAAAEAA